MIHVPSCSAASPVAVALLLCLCIRVLNSFSLASMSAPHRQQWRSSAIVLVHLHDWPAFAPGDLVASARITPGGLAACGCAPGTCDDDAPSRDLSSHDPRHRGLVASPSTRLWQRGMGSSRRLWQPLGSCHHARRVRAVGRPRLAARCQPDQTRPLDTF
jgi:hypothetical protein